MNDMKIPRAVKVIGKKYKIIVSDQIDDCGNTDSTKCSIYINPTIDDS